MSADAKPKVLFVYYTFSRQTGRVVDAMAEVLAERDCAVSKARLEFIDERFGKRFSTPNLPMRHLPALQIGSILVSQRLKRTGGIRIPPEAQGGDYDLIVIGSPTWWLTTNMPVRSYLKSAEAKAVMAGKPFAAFSVSRRYWKGNMKDVRNLDEANGANLIDQTHFLAAGDQVKSMLSWLGWIKHGEAQKRVLGMGMPPPNLQPDFEEQGKRFIEEVADRALSHRAEAVAAG